MNTNIIIIFGIITLLQFPDVTIGHGMMLQPPNRSSLWRFDKSAPINYNDNENYCGGLKIHWDKNGGKCGVCGDDYKAPHPQPNENKGKYGTGKIVAHYKSGQVIDTQIRITANHLGYIQYHLCEIKNSNKPEPGETCFKLLRFENGSDKFQVKKGVKDVRNRVKLPNGFKCKHCVLRWHYKAGNNWGICSNGKGKLGCGPQEFFRSCSDISIN